MMRYVIAGEKLKEGVEAMRRQLAFMIRFVSSPVMVFDVYLFSYLRWTNVQPKCGCNVSLCGTADTSSSNHAQLCREWSLSHGK